MKKTTRQIEMVETHNLALCLDRLCKSGGQGRALYHAICMSNAFSNYEQRKAIREALRQP